LTTRALRKLTDELIDWRDWLVKQRDVQGIEVTGVIEHLNAAIVLLIANRAQNLREKLGDQ